MPILVEEREGFVPAGCALVTLRFLPAKWRKSGAIGAVLESAGYSSLEIQEFGVPLCLADGSRFETTFRNDVHAAVVRTPPGDPASRCSQLQPSRRVLQAQCAIRTPIASIHTR